MRVLGRLTQAFLRTWFTHCAFLLLAGARNTVLLPGRVPRVCSNTCVCLQVVWSKPAAAPLIRALRARGSVASPVAAEDSFLFAERARSVAGLGAAHLSPWVRASVSVTFPDPV